MSKTENNKYETILIFQKPDLYFFPCYKDIVFSPFGVREHGLCYWIYKILHLFRLPCCCVFWGGWKEHIAHAKRVIIFDYGYQAGMETYIHKVNPACEVYLFFWNVITKYQKNHLLFTDKEAIYSTDKGDCALYGFHFQPIFYTKMLYTPYCGQYADKLFFLGVDKGRGTELVKLKNLLSRCGLNCDIRLVCHSKNKQYRKACADILTRQRLDYAQYCDIVRHSGVLLDIVQKGQQALTMRVMEAIYFSKKLITNNQDIVHYDFYCKQNIFVLPDDLSQFSIKDVKAFLKEPFAAYPESVLNRYDFEYWKLFHTECM